MRMQNFEQRARRVKAPQTGDATGHDWFHTQRVLAISYRLARQEECDLDIMLTATLLQRKSRINFTKEVINLTKKLFFSAILKFVAGVILVGLLVFLPAGAFDYFRGWLLIGLLFVPMFLAGIVMMVKNPDLLRKRLNAKEQQSGQSLVIKLSGLMFLAGFILAGLDFRFGWFPLPNAVSYAAAALFLLAYLMYAQVLRQNTYLSRTVEVQDGQKVIDTGLYGVVRHPMYSATLLLFLSMPLVLGSLISFGVFLLYPVLIVFRIRGEERLLEAQLQGYQSYKQKVTYRLIPYVW